MQYYIFCLKVCPITCFYFKQGEDILIIKKTPSPLLFISKKRFFINTFLPFLLAYLRPLVLQVFLL